MPKQAKSRMNGHMIPRADKPIRPAAKNNVPTGKTEVRFASLLSGGFATMTVIIHRTGNWQIAPLRTE